jgi:hypothetical protein
MSLETATDRLQRAKRHAEVPKEDWTPTAVVEQVDFLDHCMDDLAAALGVVAIAMNLRRAMLRLRTIQESAEAAQAASDQAEQAYAQLVDVLVLLEGMP